MIIKNVGSACKNCVALGERAKAAGSVTGTDFSACGIRPTPGRLP